MVSPEHQASPEAPACPVRSVPQAPLATGVDQDSQDSQEIPDPRVLRVYLDLQGRLVQSG